MKESERAFLSEELDAIVIGGGLAGLGCAQRLTEAGKKLAVIEKDERVGGLARTITEGEFSFDLGGHRFFTKKGEIYNFVEELLGEELIDVGRSSKIYLKGKYFDYPLKAGNAFFGMGAKNTLKILSDYLEENLRKRLSPREAVSLEDWVVDNFGRTLFELFFKEYSEKVWGLSCSEISRDWVAQRIQGLSLGKAVKNSLFNGEKDIATLIKRFSYPKRGIGVLPEAILQKIARKNRVFTGLSVDKIYLDGKRIKSVRAGNCNARLHFKAENVVSSLPVSSVVKMLEPRAPGEVLKAAQRLKFRDTIIVAIFVDRDRVTGESWIYFPDREIPFGRLHETKNWSRALAPEGKSCLVVEYFCFKGDELWRRDDSQLIESTIGELEELGYIAKSEALGGRVERVEKAYPLFKVGYREEYETLQGFLSSIENLHTIGRSGRFEYFNMDHAIESGLKAAESLLGIKQSMKVMDKGYLEEVGE